MDDVGVQFCRSCAEDSEVGIAVRTNGKTHIRVIASELIPPEVIAKILTLAAEQYVSGHAEQTKDRVVN